MVSVDLATKGSTGTGLFKARNFAERTRIAFVFEVESVGATPTVTVQFVACPPDKDPTVTGNYTKVAYVTEDATVATSTADYVTTTTGKKTVYIDGLDKRFYDAVGVNITANTNVTFSARAIYSDRA